MENQSPTTLAAAIDEWLKNAFHTSLVDLCKALRYDAQSIDIISADESNKTALTALYKKHRALFNSYNVHAKGQRPAQGTWTAFFKEIICVRLSSDILGLLLKGNGVEVTRVNAPLEIQVPRSPMKVAFNGNTRILTVYPFASDAGMSVGFVNLPDTIKQMLDRKEFLVVLLDFAHGEYLLIDSALEKPVCQEIVGLSEWRFVLMDNGKEARPLSFFADEIKSSCVPIEAPSEPSPAQAPASTPQPAPAPQKAPCPPQTAKPKPPLAPPPKTPTPPPPPPPVEPMDDFLTMESTPEEEESYANIECDFV